MSLYDCELEYAMRMLYVAAQFYAHDRLDELLHGVDSDATLSIDYILEFDEAAVYSVFQDTRGYSYEDRKPKPHRPENYDDVVVFRDPLLTRYAALCREYEQRKGITKVENRYARNLTSAVQQAMQIPSYCYDYRWYDGSESKKEPRLVMLFSEEFDVYCEVSSGLFDILDFCKEGIAALEAELAKPDSGKVISLPARAQDQLKEAA